MPGGATPKNRRGENRKKRYVLEDVTAGPFQTPARVPLTRAGELNGRKESKTLEGERKQCVSSLGIPVARGDLNPCWAEQAVSSQHFSIPLLHGAICQISGPHHFFPGTSSGPPKCSILNALQTYNLCILYFYC